VCLRPVEPQGHNYLPRLWEAEATPTGTERKRSRAMTNRDVYEKASQAAKSAALPTEQLLGEVFSIESFQGIETKFGQRFIATIRWPVDSDATQEAWMSGVVLSRQLEAIKDDLPAVFSLHREDEPNSPYELVEPDEKPTVKKPPASRLGRVPGPDDPLDYFRLGNGKLDTKAFVVWWQEQGFGPDDLADVVGATSASAVEAWFAADPMRTIQALIEEAQQIAHQDEEELPFE